MTYSWKEEQDRKDRRMKWLLIGLAALNAVIWPTVVVLNAVL
jgi:hypothetical protein